MMPMPPVWRTFVQYWHLEPHEGKRLWLALSYAHHSAAAGWRRSVCFCDENPTPRRSIASMYSFMTTVTSPQAEASEARA